MLPTMQLLVEDAMYVSQGGIEMYVGYVAYQWICEYPLSLPHSMINQ